MIDIKSSQFESTHMPVEFICLSDNSILDQLLFVVP